MTSGRVHSAAELEEAYGDRSWEHYRPLLATVVEFSPPGRILDLGAGTGLFVECCRRFGIPCYGLEGAAAGVAMAAARGIDLVRARLDDGLPFADGRFAAVVCNQVIEHLDEAVVERTLVGAHRVLQPGGALFIWSPSPRDRSQRHEPGHINLYTPSRLRRRVQASGFRVVAERNSPLAPLGHGRLRDLLGLGLLRLSGLDDLLSATANVIATRVP